ncbi:ThiF family adenylyltransferase, partial [Gemmatimonas sp.]|uniref:ThiF family adenylyltransferase n=1 Tax=Gemmatimonas sp. TaxID=1962908 RepID=UPI00286CCDD5
MKLPDTHLAAHSRYQLTITTSQHEQLQAALFADTREAFAVLFCGASETTNCVRLLAHELWIAPDHAYRVRKRDRLEIVPGYLNDVVTHAETGGWHVVLVHSHPGDAPAFFSHADDAGDGRLLPVLASLLPTRRVASAVITATDMIARTLDPRSVRAGIVSHECREFVAFDDIEIRGDRCRRLGGASLPTLRDTTARLLDRQVRAVGLAEQRRLGHMRAGVVGAGGTGSATLEQLIRSGIMDLLLVDPDTFESSNWSRVWGSRAEHAREADSPSAAGGMLKVDVQAEHLRSIHPDVRLRTIADSVVNDAV